MNRELYVDEAECTGCEYCAAKLPDVFFMKNGISVPVSPIPPSMLKAIEAVIANCPAECIAWKEKTN